MMILAAGYALLLAAAQGDVRVLDGDTLVLSGTPILLGGADLPRDPPVLAETARDHVRRLVAESFVSCRLTGESLADRMLGTCYADGADIAADLVAHGMALDCESFSQGQYRALETAGLRDAVNPASRCAE